jgi:amino acid transporter
MELGMLEELKSTYEDSGLDSSLEVGATGLNGRLGTWDIVFTVLAYNAPLTVVVGLIPIMISSGNGLGAPVTFLACGALMMLFAVGFTTMSRHVPKAGAYYALVAVGLGRPLGLAAAMVAILAYAFFLIGTFLYAGLVFSNFVSSSFGLRPLSWQQWAMVIWLAVSILGYLRISLSAKVLTIALIAEVLVVVTWEAAIALTKGSSNLSPAWLTMDAIKSGSTALAILFGVTCFAGFEATAVFREEARNPNVTIPRATYASIAIMALIFSSATYAFVTGYGPERAQLIAASAPATASLESIGAFLGRAGLDVVSALTCTSIFACLLALHNILARYIYSLSRDGVFSRKMSAVHTRHGSPHRASILVSIIGIGSVVALIANGVDPYRIYASFVGIAGYALLWLQILTCVAVVIFFARSATSEGHWRTRYAPTISLIGLVSTAWFATTNLQELTGDRQLAIVLLCSVFAVLAGGALYATWLRRKCPKTYLAIGRQDL